MAPGFVNTARMRAVRMLWLGRKFGMDRRPYSTTLIVATNRETMPRAIWIACYLFCMWLVVIGMIRARRAAVDGYGTESAQTAWDSWRSFAETETNTEGPVQRRSPKSDEPPALVLMRDYFYACTAFALLMSSILFGTMALMIRGRDRADGNGFIPNAEPVKMLLSLKIGNCHHGFNTAEPIRCL